MIKCTFLMFLSLARSFSFDNCECDNFQLSKEYDNATKTFEVAKVTLSPFFYNDLEKYKKYVEKELSKVGDRDLDFKLNPKACRMLNLSKITKNAKKITIVGEINEEVDFPTEQVTFPCLESIEFLGVNSSSWSNLKNYSFPKLSSIYFYKTNIGINDNSSDFIGISNIKNVTVNSDLVSLEFYKNIFKEKSGQFRVNFINSYVISDKGTPTPRAKYTKSPVFTFGSSSCFESVPIS